jgi:LytS/YehU family sensor histidine kinase
LADAELASKRLQMNPHFLFNALDAISNFIFKNQPKDAVQYMGKLAKMMRLTLDSSRSTFMVIADEKELIEKYLDLCILRYGTFKTSVEVDDDLDPYDYHVPPMLVQPLVENAVQHAIRPLLAEGKEGSIRVQFSLQGPSVQITITDNGPGFDPAQKASKSHGLAIIEERLHLLSKKYGGEFSLHCNRLGEEHSPDGMQVSLILTMENDG